MTVQERLNKLRGEDKGNIQSRIDKLRGQDQNTETVKENTLPVKSDGGSASHYGKFTAKELTGGRDYIQSMLDRVNAEIDEANNTMPGMNPTTRAGMEQLSAWYSRVTPLQQRKKELESQLNSLAGEYYKVENEEKLREVNAGGLAGAYAAGKEARDQQKDLATIMLGMGFGGGIIPKNVAEQYAQRETERKTAEDALANSGYNFERMAGYEDMLQDREDYLRETEETRKFAQKHGVLSSAASVLLSPVQSAEYVLTALKGAGKSDPADLENYVPLNAYNMDMTNFVGTVRDTVSREIEEKTDWELFGQNVASFLYQTGMSIADSAYMAATTGKLSSVLMGMSAASNQTKNVIERGGTNRQALVGGLASGAAEMIFEAVSIGNLLAPKSVTSMKSLLKETAKQAGVEASEEMLTEIANVLTDAAIMGQGSDFEVDVANYKAEGMTDEEARRQAFLDCVGQVAMAGVGGALSGGVMGGGVSGLNYGLNRGRNNGFEVIEQAAMEMAEGKGVSNNAATAILNDGEAVAALMEATGKTVTEDMTKSQQRSAVKEAVAELNRARMERSAPVAGTETTVAEGAESGPLTGKDTAPMRKVKELQVWDNARVDRAAKALGKAGQKTAREAYMAEAQDAAEYFKSFAAYYDAGVTGRDMSKVRADYAPVLTEGQRMAAYEAGRSDAARTAERQRAGLDFVTVYGQDSGLVDNDYAKGLEKSRAATLNRLGRAAGVKIELVESIRNEAGESIANGWYKNGVIKIAMDAENPILTVGAHEVTHRLQEIAPEAYTRYRDYAVNVMLEGGMSVDAYLDRYAGQNLTREQAMDEMAADFTQELLMETRSFRDLMDKDSSVARKVLDAVKAFVEKVKKVFAGDKGAQNRAAVGTYGADLDTLERAVQLWGEALNEGTQAVGAQKNTASTEGSGEGKYSFKGYDEKTGKGIYESNFPVGTAKAEKSERILALIQDVWSKKPIDLVITENGKQRTIQAKFDPTYDATGNTVTDAAKLMGGNKHGNSSEKRVTLDLADDYYQIASEASYNYSKAETGKNTPTHEGVNQWHYFVNDIYFIEQGDVLAVPYRVTINVKEKNDGNYVYSFSAERQNKRPSTQRTLHAAVNQTAESGQANAQPSEVSVPQTGGDVNGKFSLKSPVERAGNLIALHNMDGEKIDRTLSLGAWPAPSIAIVQASQGHSSYGEYSAVFRAHTIDPQADSRNRVYGSDAWTPTHNQTLVESEVDYGKKREFERLIEDLSRDIGGGAFNMGSVLSRAGIDNTSKKSIREIAEQIAKYPDVQAAYLATQGEDVEVQRREKSYHRFGNEAVRRYTRMLTIQELAALDMAVETRDRATIEAAAPQVKQAARDVYEEVLRNRRTMGGKPISEEVIQLRLNKYVNDITDYHVESFIQAAWEMTQAGDNTGEIDRQSMAQALNDRVDKRDVALWAEGLLDGLLVGEGIYNGVDIITDYGRRDFAETHVPVTAENLVEAMYRDNAGRGVGAYAMEASGLQSAASTSYRTVEDIRSDSHRLGKVPEAEMQVLKDEINERLSGLWEKLDALPGASAYNIPDAVINAAGLRYVDDVISSFKQDGIRAMSEDTALELIEVFEMAAQLPTEYFEAKPERVVPFNEALAVVSPDDAPADRIKRMRDAGMNVIFYKAGNEADRLDKVNSVEGARFSLKGTGRMAADMAALQRENEALRERVEYWKGQTRRTVKGTVDKKAVNKAAKELIRMYGADLKVSDINGELKALWDYMGVAGNEVNYGEVRRRATEVAGWIVDNAVAQDNELYETYEDLRKYLKTTELVVSERDKGDFADWGDFRKRNFGKLKIKNGAKTNVDGVFQELEYYWPELFNSEAVSHPMDQLRHIAEVAGQVYAVTETNPFSYDRENAVEGIANEIIEKFFDIPEVAETFADKEARKRDELAAQIREESRERVERAIIGEKMASGRELAKFEREYRERTREERSESRTRQEKRELNAKIVRHTKALSQKLVRPTDKANIPENLRQSVALLLDSINLESSYELAALPGGKNKRVAPYTKGAAATKRTEAARKLQAAYKRILMEENGGAITVDPDLEENLLEVMMLGELRLSEMNVEQLRTVWNTLKMVESSVTRADRAFSAGRMNTITQIAEGIREDNRVIGERGEYRRWAAGIDKLLNTDMLTPQGYFHRLGPTGDYLFKAMREAQDKHIRIMEQAQKATEKVVGKEDIRKLEREMHTFDLSGGKLALSTAQIMSLHELMKREQAREHILLGGIRPDSADTGKGLKLVSRSEPVKVTAEDIGKIISVLTDEQVTMANGLQKYMGSELAKLGNEAAMAVYGYEKFKDKNYFPIKVDKNQTQRDVGKEAKGGTIAGRGFTKSLTPDAKNAVMVGSIFDVYADHVNGMATYAAWLGTMEDIRRVRNYTFWDGEKNRLGDVQSIIERVMGKNGLGYLDKLMKDINQGVHTQGTGSPFDTLLGNYKAASVAANLRVVLQQPTAAFRALDMIDPKYLAQGAVKKGDWDKVKKYAPIAVWKDWGYMDVNTGRQMKDVLLSSDTWMDRAKQMGMAAAGKADAFTWARLWNAVEAEVKDQRKELKPGSEEFHKVVANRFNDIIDRTQVVDGLLQRSQIMRSPDALQKMATSYMSEPTKTYNMFLSAVYDYRRAEGKDGKAKAKKELGRTVTALTTSFAINALAQSIMDAFRDDDKEKTWAEKLLEAYVGFTGDEDSFADYWNSFWDGNLEAAFNPLGYVPYGKDVLSIIQGYDVTRMDVEPISKMVDAAQNMMKALSGESKKSVFGALTDLIAEGARLLGVPVANLKRDVLAFVNTAAGWAGSDELQYHIDKLFKNVKHSGNRKNFMDILYSASVNDREEYEDIYEDMIQSGVSAETIKNAMESRMKEAQGVTGVDELEQRYMSPEQETAYQGYMSGVAGSSLWERASEGQRDALEEAAYEMAVGSKEGVKMQEKIDGGARYGIDATDLLLYELALEMADKPTESGKLGTYTNDEVEEAIRMIPGLSDAARSYLWTAQGKSEKSDPWG